MVDQYNKPYSTGWSEVTDLNLSMRKNDDVDHEAILALLESASMMDTATISGKTTSKSGEGRAGVVIPL